MRKPGTVIEQQTVIPPFEGEPFGFGAVGGQFKIGGDAIGGRFVVAHLPEIPPRILAAPLHRHHNEDEYTYVVAGTLGLLVEDEVVTATPGTWLVKPPGQWHTFWNAGDEPCHIIEVVSPARFEGYFHDAAQSGGDPERLSEINEKYAINMKLESVPQLCERFGLAFPQPGP